jgi:hypothetical protein
MSASMTAEEARRLRARNFRTLALLAVLFLLPLVGSAWLYYGTQWRPAGHVNHGELIEPPRRLPAITLPRLIPRASSGAPAQLHWTPAPLFRGEWSLVYIGDGRCDAGCRRTLEIMRATHLSLGEDMTRVAPLFLVTGNCCAADLAPDRPALLILDASGSAGSSLLAQFPKAGRAHSIYVVDPLGNLMMRYDVRRDPRGLLLDLMKLLRLSQIG